MAPRWFCNLAGSELGPLSPSQLKKLAATGRLRKDDFVRKGTDGEWVRAGRVKGLFKIQDGQANSEEPASEPASESATLPVVDTSKAEKPATAAAPRPIPMRPNQGRGDSVSGSPTIAQWRLEKDRAARRRTMYLLAGFVAIVSVGVFVVLYRPTSTSQRNVSRSAEGASPQAADSGLDLDLDLDLASEMPEDDAAASMNGVDDAAKEVREQDRDAAENDPFAGAIDASTREAVALGAVRALVESVLLGPPRLERAPGRFARPSNSYLVVRLGLRSSDDAKRVEYNGWSNFQSVSLSDELGNKYPQKRFRGASVVGQVDRAGLYSDKPLTDVLVFERPVPRARRLRLELPGIAIGEGRFCGIFDSGRDDRGIDHRFRFAAGAASGGRQSRRDPRNSRQAV